MQDTQNVSFQEFPGFKLKLAANHTMSELTDVLCEFDLRISEAAALLYIRSEPGCLQTEVGKTLKIASANLTPLLSKLEKRNLITKTPVDGRSNGLHIHEQSKDFVERLSRTLIEFETAFIAKIPERLRAPFLESLQYLLP
jgi:DNA-binding MarR family transcriptional regulator